MQKYERDAVQGEAEQRNGLRLHEIIIRAARNDMLTEMLAKLYDRLQMFVWIDAIYADEAALTRREHEAIIDAAKARDEKLLLRLMEQHLAALEGQRLAGAAGAAIADDLKRRLRPLLSPAAVGRRNQGRRCARPIAGSATPAPDRW